MTVASFTRDPQGRYCVLTYTEYDGGVETNFHTFASKGEVMGFIERRADDNVSFEIYERMKVQKIKGNPKEWKLVK